MVSHMADKEMVITLNIYGDNGMNREEYLVARYFKVSLLQYSVVIVNYLYLLYG